MRNRTGSNQLQRQTEAAIFLLSMGRSIRRNLSSEDWPLTLPAILDSFVLIQILELVARHMEIDKIGWAQ